MSTFFSLASLFLGMMSWAIPMIAIKQHKKGRSITNYSVYSLCLCSGALIFQLFEIQHRVNMMDWSSLMDTIGAISIVSMILVVIAVLLNLMANSKCKADNQ
ncbi:MAG: hypothetical protein RR226_02220 [Oscillospiraceae bacterium]